MIVEEPPGEETQHVAIEEEPFTGTDVGGDEELVLPSTEVHSEEAFLDVQVSATLHEEGLDPPSDNEEPDQTTVNELGVVWEKEEVHVMVDSRDANGPMDRQQCHGLPSSCIPLPLRETEALQHFLQFFSCE
eukprot:scaffold810_cov355-Pavlova_lutheri.AAC.2